MLKFIWPRRQTRLSLFRLPNDFLAKEVKLKIKVPTKRYHQTRITATFYQTKVTTGFF